MKKTEGKCPACGEKKYWEINRNRLRCCRCRKDYSLRPGRAYLNEERWRLIIRTFLKRNSIEDGSEKAGVNRQRYLRAVTEIRTVIKKKLLNETKDWNFKYEFDNLFLIKVKKSGSFLINLAWCPQKSKASNSVAFRLISKAQTKKHLSKKGAFNWKFEDLKSKKFSLWLDSNKLSKADLDDIENDEDERKLTLKEKKDIFLSDHCDEYLKLTCIDKYFKTYLVKRKGIKANNFILYLAEMIWKFRNRGQSQEKKIQLLLEALRKNKRIKKRRPLKEKAVRRKVRTKI